MGILLGVIADDFTGATDIASILVREGMRTVMSIGVPAATFDVHDADAVVVALKSRTIPVADAVAQSLDALRWLQTRGAEQIFFKYCSTFDSTAKGNIGPVADALSDALGAAIAVVCPAFPKNGRSVFNGHLFVGPQLLQDSPMKDHPLTPMRRSDLVALMAEQSAHGVGLVPHEVISAGDAAISEAFAAIAATGQRYVVVDAIHDDHLRSIGRAIRGHKLVTGGSALAMGLPANFGISPRTPAETTITSRVPPRTAILAGSCSAATRQQLARAKALWPSRRIDLDAVAEKRPVVQEVLSWAKSQPADQPVVIYGSADPAEVEENQARYGSLQAGAMMEHTLAAIAEGLVADGVGRLLVAGGETSGAVISALKVQGLSIGAEIAPGVPWTTTLSDRPLQVALKSGNFGGPDFFERALDIPA
ncbi:3-oxo-tetronate kinase [Mesorhizobium sp.]|uniref:3-oxo-tetronate kinase n=1 Tax=Mesorhizobium sp. TaxID=1871066 RepID=UPI000FE53197|nr:3-oxo-tetronate kinase [Mesorhizobium sp.]RWB68655.1 MAG: four-carbon acid sugar kinase family protein [Mesorhizobium sp.]RWB90903.1 MAG: four-carbon acid sugar kinase family protein [Mesorhizobium sp.]